MAKPQALIQAGGIRALSRSIRIMVDKDLGDEMRAASRAAAEKIVPYAKKAVPVGTGRLQASIKADATRSRAIIKAGTPGKTPYAMAVHRGRYIKSSGKRTRATKYLSSMIPKAWPEMVDEYVRAMDKIAKKFNKKHGVSRVYGRFGSGGK